MDDIGNRTKLYAKSASATEYEHNPVNEYTSVGGTGYEYDAAGNLTKDDTHYYHWDYENRLTKVELVSDTSDVAEYTYDATMRRVEKIDERGESDVTTRFYYDSWSAIEERDGSNTLQATYINGPRIDDYVTMNRDSTDYWYMQSPIVGNVCALVDTEGVVQEGYTYTAYGDALVHTAPGNDATWFTSDDDTAPVSAVGNSITFTGRRIDNESMLMYFRNRMLVMAIGSFASRDPVAYVDGMRLMGVFFVPGSDDPMGLWAEDAHRDLTVNWAEQSRAYDVVRGFKTKLIEDLTVEVGAGDTGVDYSAITSPINGTAPDRYTWHFATRNRRGPVESPDPRDKHIEDDYKMSATAAGYGLCLLAAEHLGRCLHPLQDKYSHQASHNAATPWDHFWATTFGLNPDNWNNPAWAEDRTSTETATKEKIAAFLSIPCNPCAVKAD
jgi:hypothetical protein